VSYPNKINPEITAVSNRLFIGLFIVILIGFLVPTSPILPIEKNKITKIDENSFWYYPWGESGVHKGIDIFCNKGTLILSPVNGYVYNGGYGNVAGKYVYIIGAKWRTYYFAHMDSIAVRQFAFVKKGELIGLVGNTGNAIDKPYHLHYSIKTLFPYFWQYNKNTAYPWQRIFYINPLQ
jgi:peptidoglycan LD-endopeptidase LytH